MTEGAVVGLLLAAGRGRRLRPLTDAVAKPALLVGGKPLGAYGLELLAELGGRVAVNLSWLPDQTRTILEPYVPPDTLWLVESPEPYGTAGTVAGLLPVLADTFVVVNGDSLMNLRPADLLATHRRVAASATLAVHHVTSGADLEIVDDWAVRYIDRRADPAASGAVYIGVAAFERRMIAPLLEPGRVAGLGEAVFRPLAERGELAVHVHHGFALDVGTPERLAEARRRDWS